jgi:hypothetical protein
LIEKLNNIPGFKKTLNDLQNDPKCDNISINIPNVINESRLFFEPLKECSTLDFYNLSNCQLLALKFMCSRLKSMCYNLAKNGIYPGLD